MTCDDCGGPAKPLLVGKYCVNACDLEGVKDDNPYYGDRYFDDLKLELDEWDEPTQPGTGPNVYPLHSTPCKHTHLTFAQHGNVTGMWCKDCGKLMTTP